MNNKILFVAVLTCIFWACTSDNGDSGETGGPDPIDFDRSAMLANWADNIIMPAYEDFDQKMEVLQTSFDAFKDGPDLNTLNQLRANWSEAYKTWQHISMFEIGPAETLDFRHHMNIYPADNDKIEDHVASGNYDLALASNRDAKGFPALDYLLYGLADTDEAAIDIYSGAGGANYLGYLENLIADMNLMTDTVLSEWTNGYRDTFVSNDGASATASVDRFVNDYILYYEKYLRAGKMGIPLGVFSGTVSVAHLEAYYKSDMSKSLFLEGLAAVQDFFNGDHYGKEGQGPSLAAYLDVLNSSKNGEDLTKLINDQLNTARTSVNDLGFFMDEITDNATPENMLNAYDEVQRVVPLLKVDMVSAMNIHIDFVDADGD